SRMTTSQANGRYYTPIYNTHTHTHTHTTHIEKECWSWGIVFQTDVGQNLNHVALPSSYICQPVKHTHTHTHIHTHTVCVRRRLAYRLSKINNEHDMFIY